MQCSKHCSSNPWHSLSLPLVLATPSFSLRKLSHEFPRGSVVRTPCVSTSGVVGSIPGQRTKFLHAVGCGQIKKKERNVSPPLELIWQDGHTGCPILPWLRGGKPQCFPRIWIFGRMTKKKWLEGTSLNTDQLLPQSVQGCSGLYSFKAWPINYSFDLWAPHDLPIDHFYSPEYKLLALVCSQRPWLIKTLAFGE